MQSADGNERLLPGGDGASMRLSIDGHTLQVQYSAPAPAIRTVFVALELDSWEGSAVLPFAQHLEGSTVFLPFRANKLFALQAGMEKPKGWRRTFENWKWSDRAELPAELLLHLSADGCVLRLPLTELGAWRKIKLVVYSKDFATNSWGELFAASDSAVRRGGGDKYIPHYWEVDLTARTGVPVAQRQGRLGNGVSKLRIYQLFPRLFSNTNQMRKPNGTLAENGVGKFNDIDAGALKSLRELGFTHLWLTGVLQQATATDYASIGQPADDPDLLKGLAGSPYAIKDYFDVCPDYAEEPERRIEEFTALLKRIRENGMGTLIDFVPNHVARSYASDVKPELDFGIKGQGGAGDDRAKFFHPQNNFFYLQPGLDGPPLRLPTVKDGEVISSTCKAVAGDAVPGRPVITSPATADGDSRAPLQQCDGLFQPESEHGKVTGNNAVTWTPGLGDWYETVKLNYGYDFTDGSKTVREYPNALTPDKPVPDTWTKMDRVFDYWQSLGVDGFRCDMAHMVPPEFWTWVIARARQRQPEVVFIAEAYDNDPAKVPGSDPTASQLNGGKSNVMFDLLNAGFTAVYDDPTYKTIKKIYEGPGWANDIDGARPDEFIFDNSLRYAENHDEVRLAALSQWGGAGMKAGPAICAVLFGLSRGPAMLYNGQEIGEPAAGAEGFGGDDARTTIFDYWSMPEFVKWTNGHRFDGGNLSTEQKELRASYGRLVKLVSEPAFTDGECFGLNAANRLNPSYGRIDNEQPSGHWLYSFLRYDSVSGQRFLAIVNLNPATELKDVRVILDQAALQFLDLANLDATTPLTLLERLASCRPPTATCSLEEARGAGIPLGKIAPVTACYLQMTL